MVMKCCVVCGAEFDARGSDKTCGNMCRRQLTLERGREKQRHYYQKNRQRIADKQRERRDSINKRKRRWHENNRERINQMRRLRREVDRESRNLQERRYYEDNIDKMRQKNKRNYEKNIEHMLAKSRDYYAHNRDRCNEKFRVRYLRRKAARARAEAMIILNQEQHSEIHDA